jgi:hypothetical protein
MDIALLPLQPSWKAWSTSTRWDDIGDTLERVAQQVLMEFCKQYLWDTDCTSVALFPIRDESDHTWRRCMAAACDTTLPTYQEHWAFTMWYAQHTTSLLWEVTLVGAFQLVRLEDYDHQVEAKDNLIDELRTWNQELLQQAHFHERRSKELSELRVYRNLQDRSCLLDETRTMHNTWR